MYVGYDCWFTLHYEDEMFYTRAIYQTAILNISRGELQNIYRTFIYRELKWHTFSLTFDNHDLSNMFL